MLGLLIMVDERENKCNYRTYELEGPSETDRKLLKLNKEPKGQII